MWTPGPRMLRFVMNAYTHTQNPKVKRPLSTVVIPSIIYVIITLNDDHTLSDIFLKPVARCLGMSVHPVV